MTVQREITGKQDRLVEMRADIDRLVAKETLSSGEQERFENLVRGAERLSKEVIDLQGEAKVALAAGLRDGSIITERAGEDRVPSADGSYFKDGGESSFFGRTRHEGIRSVERSRLDDDAKQVAVRLIETDRTGRADRWAQVAGDESYLSAFAKVVADPERGHLRWSDRERAAFSAVEEYRAMSLTAGDGGYMLPVSIDPSIINTHGDLSANPIRQLARVERIITDQWKGVSSEGVTASWLGEGVEVGDDSPALTQPTVATHKAAAFIPFSIEIGMDGQRFVEEMGALLAVAKSDLEAAAFIVGNGTTEPHGVFSALDANTNVEVVVTTDGAFGAVDILKVWKALPQRYRARSTWLFSTDVENEIASFSPASQGSFYTGALAENGVLPLRGRPVALTDYAPEFTGTTGEANILVVGDFRAGYLIADRVGTVVELVPHLLGVTNNRPTGQRGLYMFARVGGGVVNANAFRLLQNQ